MGFERKATTAQVRHGLTVKDFMHMQDQVVKWNRLAGNDRRDSSLTKTYQQLSHEEVFGKNELKQGFDTDDLEMIADGLCDCVFTVFMWSVFADNEFTSRDYGFLKDVEKKSVSYMDQSVESTFKHFAESVKVKDHFAAQTNLVILLQHMNEKIDIMEAFRRVCVSNYSKFPEKESVTDVLAECRMIEEKGRYRGICAKTIDHDRRIVFLAKSEVQDDGTEKVYGSPKIVKSSQFREVENLKATIR